MSKKPIITAREAAQWVHDGDTLTTSGFLASALPEALSRALETRFIETGSPQNLTLLFPTSQGYSDGSGPDHFAHTGLLMRVIGGHFNVIPKMGRLIAENKLEAYNFPQGTLSQLMRDTAAHKPGTLTHVGLDTFVDPRIEGGRLNRCTTEDLVEVVTIAGEEQLLYKAIPIDIAFIRGTFADEKGNVTLERECCTGEVTAIAQAAHNSGGRVIVQVEKIVAAGTLDPRLVKIPGICVDALVVAENPEDQAQCHGTPGFDPSLTGEIRVPQDRVAPATMSLKKIIGRRAAMELRADTVINLGIGAPELVAAVASEEGLGGLCTMTVEAGAIGGMPQGGNLFGGSVNVEAILDQPVQFDFYDGGGLDQAFLGLAECDAQGNINVSKFGSRLSGSGGFINISQNAKSVFFMGTFTTSGLRSHIQDGRLIIDQEGRAKKFVATVEQITFSGIYARKIKQPVKYITERAVFELREDGVYLTEVAPGINFQTQILDQMDFVPLIPQGGLQLMDERIFQDRPMGLKEKVI